MSNEEAQAKSSGGSGRDNAPPPSLSQSPADRPECPICMLFLPLAPNESIYSSCCGKVICKGCIVADSRARAKTDDLFESVETAPCAFCRAEPAADEKEFVARIRRRIDLHDDVSAMCQMGKVHQEGRNGLPKSREKALEMYMRAYELGSPEAAYVLAIEYNPQTAGAAGDRKKEREYAEEAAMRGHVVAQCYLGLLEHDAENFEAAAHHWSTAARAGNDDALFAVKEYYRNGLVTKDDFAGTLRAHQAAQDELKSDGRDFAKHFKVTRKC